MLANLALLALATVPSALAWGTVGQQASALVAQHYLSKTTVTAVQKLLGDSSSSYLTNAATSGATYAASSAGAWSTAYWYSWVHDDPSNGVCNLTFANSCSPAGCSWSALGNWTDILLDNPTASTTAQKKLAVQLLVSLFPMISTPLNNDATNGTFNVKFNGATTTLYNAWNTLFPQALSNSSPTTLATYILGNFTTSTKKTTSAYTYPTANTTAWLQDLSTCWTTAMTLEWMKEANALVCSSVYTSSPSALKGKELNGTYYKDAAPVVQEQIARAGYRMAAYLNLLFDGQPDLTVPSTASLPMCNTTALTQGGTAFQTS